MPDQDVQRQRRGPDAEVADAAAPPHVSRITTRHADEHVAWLSARYAGHKRRVRARHGFEFFAKVGALGGLTAFSTYYKAATSQVSWSAVPYVAVTHVRSGRYLARWQGGEVRLTNRGTMLFPPDEFVLLNDCSYTDGVLLATDTLLRVAEELRGLDRAQVRFSGLLPISAAAERQWLITADYIHRGIDSLAIDKPLVLAAAEHVVAASMLTIFPNTTMTIEVRAARDPATAATVRRAMAFIDDNAGRPITLTDIAAAVGALPRTLQYAFRRHRNTTPLAYLRRVRLAHAHDDLLSAEPGDGTTVATVAAQWGYVRPNRFAAAYRQVYGQPPSQTLRA